MSTLKTKWRFTMTELVMSVVTLSILASIAYVTLIKEKDSAERVAILSNVRNLQTSVDKFYTEREGYYPTVAAPKQGVPQKVDFKQLVSEYAYKDPDLKKARYWVDYQGKVWGSTVNVPTKISDEEGTFRWQSYVLSKNGTYEPKFNVYTVVDVKQKGDLKEAGLRLVKSKATIKKEGGFFYIDKEEGKQYMVQAVDRFGLETPPVNELYRDAATTDQGDLLPLTGEGMFTFTTNAGEPAKWLNIEKKEFVPKGAGITYQFAVAGRDKKFSSYTKDFKSLPASQYLKVAVTFYSNDKQEYPSLEAFKVNFKTLRELEEFENYIPPTGLTKEDLEGDGESGLTFVDFEGFEPSKEQIERLPDGFVSAPNKNSESPYRFQYKDDPRLRPAAENPKYLDGQRFSGGATLKEGTTYGVFEKVFRVAKDELQYVTNVDILGSLPEGTQAKVTYQGSFDCKNYGEPVSDPLLLDAMQCLKVKVELSKDDPSIPSPILTGIEIEVQPEPVCIDGCEPPQSFEEGDNGSATDDPKDPSDPKDPIEPTNPEEPLKIEWVRLTSVNYIIDAEKVGVWKKVDIRDFQPPNTRIVYRYATSNDDKTYSAFSKFEDVKNSRYLKVMAEMQYEKGKPLTKTPVVYEVNVDYEWLDGTTHNATMIGKNKGLLQDAVDKYHAKYKLYPTLKQPVRYIPEQMNFRKVSEFLDDKFEADEATYWVDYKGVVWTSTIDSPRNLTQFNRTLKWDAVFGATAYRIYRESETGVFQFVKKLSADTLEYYTNEANPQYFVSSVDRYGNIAAPVGVGYMGYKGNCNDGGKGTKDDPYVVCSEETFNKIKDDRYAYYVLERDLDFSDIDGPGYQFLTTPFFGTFDGQGNTISNVKHGNARGIFSEVGSGGVIKNLNLNIVDLKSTTSPSGGLVGILNNGTIDNVHLSNISVNSAGSEVGGLVGRVTGNNALVQNSGIKKSTIVGGTNYVGGLIGSLKKMENSGNVADGVKLYADDVTVQGSTGIGGLIGLTEGTPTIEKSYANASVKGSSSVGGLIGAINASSNYPLMFQDAFALGEVSGTSNIGGLVGYISIEAGRTVETKNTYARVKMDTPKTTTHGGLVGVVNNPSFYIPTKSSFDYVMAKRSNSAGLSTPTTVGTLSSPTYQEGFSTDVWQFEENKALPYLKNVKKPSTNLSLTADEVAQKVFDGYGTDKNPYILKKASQFDAMRFEPTAKYVLGADIDFAQEKPFVSMKEYQTTFRGSLDGRGYAIKNLTLADNGLFEKLGKNASLQNLNFEKAKMPVGASAGLLASSIVGGDVTIKNVKADVEWFDKGSSGNQMGGLVGVMTDTVSPTTGTYQNINLSENDVRISGTTKQAMSNVGGIIGYYQNTGYPTTFTKNHALWDFTAENLTSQFGGLAGFIYPSSATLLEMNYVDGTLRMPSISNAHSVIGGLYGNALYPNVRKSFSALDVELGDAAKDSAIGGLVGTAQGGSYQNVFYKGEITFKAGTTNTMVGLLMGYINSNVTLNTSYSQGKIKVGETILRNPLISTASQNYVSPNSNYFDGAMSDTIGDQNGKALSTYTMFNQKSFVNFDFTNTWTTNGSTTIPIIKGLPILERFKKTSYALTSGALDEGSGTAADPYLIETEDQLQEIRFQAESHFRIAKDIQMTKYQSGKGFIPIGTTKYPFKGSIDGNKKTISNLYIRSTDTDTGLIGYAANSLLGFIVKDLTLKNVDIKGTSYVGAVVGRKDTTTGTTYSNLNVDGKLEGTNYVGGLIGSNTYNTTISDASVNVDVKGNAYVGGIIGMSNSGFQSARVSGKGSVVGTDYVGGLYGSVSSSYSYNHERLSFEGTVSGNSAVGGLFGMSQGGTILKNSYTTGQISGVSGIGGLIGQTDGSRVDILKSYSSSDVTGTTTVGGLVGTGASMYLYDVFSLGDIKGVISKTGTTPSLIGGLAGNAPSLTMQRGYAQGKLTLANPQPDSIGVLFGQTGTGYVNASIQNVYGDAAVANWTRTAGGKVSQTQSMLSKKRYQNFDFNNVWDMKEGEETPYLRDLPKPSRVAKTVRNSPFEFFDAGDGSKENPYLIKTRTQLQNMQYELDTYYKLNNDIDAENLPFEPIGFDSTHEFTGALDGNQKTIENLKIQSQRNYGQNAMFRFIQSTEDEPKISDLTIRNASNVFYPNNTYGSILVGVFSSGQLKNITIEKAQLKSSTYAGLLAAKTFPAAKMSKIRVQGTVDAGTQSSSYMGGLIGHASGGTIDLTQANVQMVGTSANYVGGLIGMIDAAKVTRSYADAQVEGRSYVGGFIGTVNSGVVENNYALGRISSGTSNIGGFVGNLGNSGTIRQNYASVEMAMAGIPPESSIGGFIGANATGLSQPTNVGTSYYNGTLSLKEFSAGGTVSTTQSMLSKRRYDGWDFEKTWSMSEGELPHLIGLDKQENLKASVIKDKHRFEGTGTEESPYLVQDATDLDLMRYEADVFYRLKNDIELKDVTAFKPIGYSYRSFDGQLDGAGFTIRNLKVDETRSHSGLFGYLGSKAKVSNLTLENPNVKGRDYVGSLAGYSAATIKNIDVKNATVQNGSYSPIGGVFGEANSNNLMEQVTVTSTVTSSGSEIGGVVGRLNQPMKDVSIKTTINGSGLNVGGVAGLTQVGVPMQRLVVEKSTVTGRSNVGGLVGKHQGEMQEAYMTGTVKSVSVGPNVGGLVGYLSKGMVKDAFVLGTVENLISTGTVSAGGIGLMDANALVQNVYAHTKTKFSNPNETGGLVASKSSSTVTDSFFNATLSGLTKSEGGTAKNTNSMTRQDTYSKWDFDTRWSFEEDQLPWLKNLKKPSELSDVIKKDFSEGKGTSESPYLIHDEAELNAVRYEPTAAYRMVEDVKTTYTTANPMEPIGDSHTPFAGTFDGDGHVIDTLAVKWTSSRTNLQNTGLFGFVSTTGVVKQVRLKNLTVTGGEVVGGLVGTNYGAVDDVRITDSLVQGDLNVGGLLGNHSGNVAKRLYSNATVKAKNTAGGIVGANRANLRESISRATVTTTENTSGGMVGLQTSNAVLAESFAKATVKGASRIGGLMGQAEGTSLTENVFSYSDVEATTSAVGGMIGATTGSATIRNAYVKSDNIKSTSNSGQVGGLIGNDTGVTKQNLYFESESVDVPIGLGTTLTGNVSNVEPLFEKEMFFKQSFKGFDFANVWAMEDSQEIPYLRKIENPSENTFDQWNVTFEGFEGDGSIENPYLVRTAEDLNLVRVKINKHYKQVADIDLSEYPNFKPFADSKKGYFTGSYDGQNFTISNLKMVENLNTAVGLFGYTNEATLKNIRIENADVSFSKQYAGIVVGYGYNTKLSNISVQGKASFQGTSSGGVVGELVGSKSAENLSAQLDIKTLASNQGGVVGRLGVALNTATFAGTMSVENNISNIGGIVGDMNANVTNIDVTNEMTFKNTTSASRIGGAIGNQAASLLNARMDVHMNGSMVSSYLGGLVGYSTGSITQVQGKSDINMAGSGNRVGGVVGMTNNAVTNTFVNATVYTPSASAVGGVAGAKDVTAFSNISNIGDVTGSQAVGGIVGSTTQSGGFGGEQFYVNSVYGYTTVDIQNVSYDGNVRGSSFLGGIIGVSGVRAIQNAKAFGSVGSTGSNYVGGLVGRSQGSVLTSMYDGVVTGLSYVGGLVGEGSLYAYATSCSSYGYSCNNYQTSYMANRISESVFYGKVTVGSNYGAGIVGLAKNLSVRNSGAFGKAEMLGAPTMGAIMGYNENNWSDVLNSYYDESLHPMRLFYQNTLGTPLSRSQALKSASYQGFNFTGTWDIKQDVGYPYVKALGEPTSPVPEVMKTPVSKTTSRYFMVEWMGTNSNSTTLKGREMEILDENGEKLSYSLASISPQMFTESIQNGNLSNFNLLKDDKFDDVAFTAHQHSSDWTRFMVDLGSIKTLSKMQFYFGVTKPNMVKVYSVEEPSGFHVRSRSDKGALLINTVSLSTAGSPSKVEVSDTLSYENKVPTVTMNGTTIMPTNGELTFTAAVNDTADDSVSSYEWALKNAQGSVVKTLDCATSCTIPEKDIQDNYVVTLRVKDSHGEWSAVASKSMTTNKKPVVSTFSNLNMNYTKTQTVNVTASYTDANSGDAVTKYRWVLTKEGDIEPIVTQETTNFTYAVSELTTGETYTLSHSVLDKNGAWSDWKEGKFLVNEIAMAYEQGVNGAYIYNTDDGSQSYGLSRAYSLFGTNISSMRIYSNGYISFNGNASAYDNVYTSVNQLPPFSIGGWMADMHTFNGGVYVKEGSDAGGYYFLVEYRNVRQKPNFTTDTNKNFAIKVYNGGKAYLLYKDSGSPFANFANGKSAAAGFKGVSTVVTVNQNEGKLKSGAVIPLDLQR